MVDHDRRVHADDEGRTSGFRHGGRERNPQDAVVGCATMRDGELTPADPSRVSLVTIITVFGTPETVSHCWRIY